MNHFTPLFLYCIQESGEVRWSYTCQKPIFSSPTTTLQFVVVGCVDGGIYTLTHSGKLVHKVMTSAPVFSSPCAVSINGNDHILIGSHDGYLYCIDLKADGVIRWKKRSGKHVYSTPSCMISTVEHSFSEMTTSVPDSKPQHSELTFVSCKTDAESFSLGNDRTTMNASNDLKKLKGFICCCATDGKLFMVEMESGTEVASYQFPGEVFSSPVMTSFDQIIVGCRNNYVYRLSVV
ncbi:Beta-alanine-activating enzyme [Holothuria leucospilota]|uniref:Beta-alanine-activating enzyme n=1 Tax=Holothuria leucospilota TaxID=206669 RepID=A0A9Q1GZ61_HOLLE|nr:Beta-alanine-activating enzyme [Holothuria leucospilota]